VSRRSAPASLKDEKRSGVYAALSAFLDADPHELATWNSVPSSPRTLIGRAHATFADAIERMRSKMLGFKAEPRSSSISCAPRSAQDVARRRASSMRKAWFKTEAPLADASSPPAARWPSASYFPNPEIDAGKGARARRDRLQESMRENVDRDKVIDFTTQGRWSMPASSNCSMKPWQHDRRGAAPGAEARRRRGRTMLANSRDARGCS
jgi:hypothetical protein